jgi:hypothetical protein
MAWFFRLLPVAAAIILVSLVLNHFFGAPGTTRWKPEQLLLAGVAAAGGALAIAVMAVLARRNRPHN